MYSNKLNQYSRENKFKNMSNNLLINFVDLKFIKKF